jgi:NAD(P)-dependent dehydrogenase (short-subunit alcohol dehydrogenase family)
MTATPELEGKTALVTGAGTGIGAAIAVELAARGAKLILVARDMQRLETVATSIRERGFEAQALAGDIRSESFLAGLLEAAGRVDILVNNAAVFASYGPLEEVSRDEIQAVLDVDLVAALYLTQMALPGMKAAGWGRIIHLGSVAGSLGAVGQVAYSTAKAGLVGLWRPSAP